MKLALTPKEVEYLNAFLDDGKSWGRPLCHPHRTLLEKWLKVLDKVEETDSYIYLSADESTIGDNNES